MEGNIIIFIIALWLILTIVGDWLLFRKAGKPGILSLIPGVNLLVEYSICWSGFIGLIYFVLLCAVNYYAGAETPPIAGVLGLLVLIINWIESHKLARAFGKGFGYGLFLFFFNRFARVVLGLSSAEYVGKP